MVHGERGVTAEFASVRPWWHDGHSPSRLLEQAHLIGAHHLQGEWWVTAKLLLEARAEIAQTGSWSGFLAEIPMSRMHAWRLCKLAEAGLAQEGMSLRATLRALAVLHGSV